MAESRELLSQLRIDPEARAASPGPRRLWPWLLAGLLLAAAAYALGRGGLGDGRPEVQVATARGVATGSAATGGTVLDASGYVVARRQATVSSKVTGKVMDLLIEEGLRVEAGAVLARIDDSNVRTQLALVEAQAEAARRQAEEVAVQFAEAGRSLRRQKELYGRQLVSEASLDAARAQHDALQLRLANARQQVVVAERQVAVQRQQLEDTVVRAPFAGVITVKNAQPGEMISPLSAGGAGTRTGIGTLVDMDSLEVEVDVSENFINRVQAGQPVSVRLNAYPDAPLAGRVIAVIPTADRAKATVRVRIGFEAADARLLPEMGVRVSFLDERPPAATEAPVTGVRIPAAALRDETVWVLREGRAERRAVSGVRVQGEAAVIAAGLRTGEQVILDPPADLAEGQALRVRGES